MERFGASEVIRRLVVLGRPWVEANRAVAELFASLVLGPDPIIKKEFALVPRGQLARLLLGKAGGREKTVTQWLDCNGFALDQLERDLLWHRPQSYTPPSVRARGRRGNFEISLGASPVRDPDPRLAEPLRAALLVIPVRRHRVSSLGGAVQMYEDFVAHERLVLGQLPAAVGQIWLDGLPYAFIGLNNRLVRLRDGKAIDEAGKPIAPARSAA